MPDHIFCTFKDGSQKWAGKKTKLLVTFKLCREDSYEVPENMAEFAVKYKLDADGLQVNDLIAQKDFLARRLSVPSHLLQVLSWERGSVVITYRIMRDVLPLAELALYREDARAELTQNGVEDVYFASRPSEQPGLVRSRGIVHG